MSTSNRVAPNEPLAEIYVLRPDILAGVTKHLVDIDEDALSAARAELRTRTIKETVNEALRRASSTRTEAVKKSLDVLARIDLDQREHGWR